MTRILLSFILVTLITLGALTIAEGAGCPDDATCSSLCGYAGPGKCVDGNYCQCATCPQRSPSEMTGLPKVCTFQPTSTCHGYCPPSNPSLTNGKVYTGHECLHGTSSVCICLCMPTTAQSVVDVLQCPFPNPNAPVTATALPTTNNNLVG